MLPTLSQLQAWDTEHLVDAAHYWSRTADLWEDVFLQVRNQSHTIVWDGAGGEALRARTGGDLVIVTAKADQLRQAAVIAREGAGTIGAAQRRVIYAVQDANDAGFNVGEDLSVADTRTSRTAAEQASRQAQAQAFAADIRQRATQLIGAEHEAGAKITAATAGIATTFPETPHDHKPHVQAVDHTWEQEPSPPQPPMSREQAAAGLKDVNKRIWEHNHIYKPFIESLPSSDPRRADFHAETQLLNAEKQHYLDVLPQQHPPTNVIGPGGVNLPGVPPGVISDTPAKSGQGWIYSITPNQPGIDPRVVSIRVMEPTAQYPHGYLNYLNIMGQEVDPFTGRTVSSSDPFAHIPVPN
ncbi:hypothetical protein LAUMK191_03114 [Mycobacterium attenuatum]|nr:hypothetical protein LAUMK191_03114 [Mycobacterium attenuatum]